jgi:hypothetical protein
LMPWLIVHLPTFTWGSHLVIYRLIQNVEFNTHFDTLLSWEYGYRQIITRRFCTRHPSAKTPQHYQAFCAAVLRPASC